MNDDIDIYGGLTRVQLYEALKTAAPATAVGKSRAPRGVLIGYLERVRVGRELAARAATPPEAPSTVKPVVKRAKRYKKKPAVEVVVPVLSGTDVRAITRALFLMGDAANLLASASVGLSGIAAMLYLSTGVPVETTLRVLIGLQQAPMEFMGAAGGAA
jgi:hypothetical protein